MVWLQENWIIAAVGLVVAIALLIWIFARRNRSEAEPTFGAPEEPRKPLEPAKPDIIAAEPARFKPKEPAPVAVPPMAPADPVVQAEPAPAPEPVVETPVVPEPAPTPSEPEPTAMESAPVASEPVATPAAKPDNLQLLKGVGPKMATLLGGLGVSSFAQIAAWTDADIATIDPQLGAFQGRIARDNIVDQAGFLARGDKAGFEAKYGALGGEL